MGLIQVKPCENHEIHMEVFPNMVSVEGTYSITSYLIIQTHCKWRGLWTIYMVRNNSCKAVIDLT